MRGIDAAGTVHDLANVLAVLSASAAMVSDDLKGLPGDHPARDGAARIALAADRASELCERLRAPHRAPRRPSTLDLASATREGLDMLAALLPGPRLEETAAPLPVRCRPLDVLQVVLNLCLNAAEASPGGSVTVSNGMWVADRDEPTIGRLVPGRRYACLSVEDDGRGINPWDAKALFEPGVTASRERGRGRGLAVVASIMTEAGGAVRVERSGTGGAIVVACWPLAETERHDLSDRNLLIVGGASRMIAGVADAAETAGADVSLCLDPADAIASVAEDVGAWDGVIVAGAARGLDAAEIGRRLREADGGLAVVVPERGAPPGTILGALATCMAEATREEVA